MKWSVINNLNYQTQLLESLDWDENQLSALELYLNEVLNSEVTFYPDVIISHIKEHFTEEASQVVYEIFKEVALHCSIFEGDDNEH